MPLGNVVVFMARRGSPSGRNSAIKNLTVVQPPPTGPGTQTGSIPQRKRTRCRCYPAWSQTRGEHRASRVLDIRNRQTGSGEKALRAAGRLEAALARPVSSGHTPPCKDAIYQLTMADASMAISSLVSHKMSLNRGQEEGFGPGSRGWMEIRMGRAESLTVDRMRRLLDGNGEIGFTAEGKAELCTSVGHLPWRADQGSPGARRASPLTVRRPCE